MQRRGWLRWLVSALGVLALVLAVLGSYAAYLLHGQGVRLRVEAALTRSLGRRVTMANLRLSSWTGAAVADDLRIADDPAFSQAPFVSAGSVRIGLDVPTLLLRRQIHIRSIALEQPAVQLLRNAEGKWNGASLAPRRSQTDGASHRKTDVDIASIAIDRGSVLVQTASASGETVRRSFLLRTLEVRDLRAGASASFHLMATLPAGGSVTATGTAGPWGEGSEHPVAVEAHVEADHLDMLRAGLVGADARVGGELAHAAVDIHWSDPVLTVSQVRVESSKLMLRSKRSEAVDTAAGHTTTTVWKRMLQHLVVKQADVHVSALEVERARGSQLRLDAVDASLRGWAPGQSASFRVSTATGGGMLRAQGSYDVPAAGVTRPARMDAEVRTAHVHLAGSGLLSPGVPVDAVADSNVHLQMAEERLRAAGTFRLLGLRMARNGTPASMPVSGNFRLQQTHGEGSGAGTLEAATLQLGSATLHTEGNYTWGGAGPTLRMRVRGERMPVDTLEAYLPSAGVMLPEGSQLRGGVLTVSLEVAGAPSHPEVSGPVAMEGAELAGFDLGSKLRSLASFTGGRLGSATVQGTTLRNLNFNLHAGSGLMTTDRLSADIAGIGTATGAGTIGPGGTLDYRLALKLNELVPGSGGPSGLVNQLAGALSPAWAKRLQGAVQYLSRGPMRNGVPLLIRGTARKPSITPDLGALLPEEQHR